jgi:transcriptional regulator with XRE-family HTH domain
MVSQGSDEARATSHIHLVPNTKRATSHALDLLGTELRNDGAPLAHGGGADAQRPRDIRGSLKVINNVFLEHDTRFTTVKVSAQPQLQKRLLTSVDMDKNETIADRLLDAMHERGVIPSGLAEECRVSPAAVHKWTRGGKLSADNLAAVARALGVREDWLRTGKLPRGREQPVEDHDIEKVVDMLAELQGPLAALANAIAALTATRAQKPHSRKKG